MECALSGFDECLRLSALPSFYLQLGRSSPYYTTYYSTGPTLVAIVIPRNIQENICSYI